MGVGRNIGKLYTVLGLELLTFLAPSFRTYVLVDPPMSSDFPHEFVDL